MILPVRHIPILDNSRQSRLLPFQLFRLPFLKPLFHLAPRLFIAHVDRRNHLDVWSRDGQGKAGQFEKARVFRVGYPCSCD